MEILLNILILRQIKIIGILKNKGRKEIEYIMRRRRVDYMMREIELECRIGLVRKIEWWDLLSEMGRNHLD